MNIRYLTFICTTKNYMNTFDIVIPFHEKDRYTINPCLISCLKYVQGTGNVYIISKEKPTDIAVNFKWVDEKDFFTVDDVLKVNPNIAPERAGWYLQQLIKLYVFECIPGINPNVLILDADVIFLTRTFFFHKTIPLYSHGNESHPAYFEIMSKLHPSFERITDLSGVAHMCVFQKHIIDEIHQMVKEYTNKSLFDAIIENVVEYTGSGFSEYELYFHFLYKFHKDEFFIRKLNYMNVKDWKDANNTGYLHYIANHSWMRE